MLPWSTAKAHRQGLLGDAVSELTAVALEAAGIPSWIPGKTYRDDGKLPPEGADLEQALEKVGADAALRATVDEAVAWVEARS